MFDAFLKGLGNPKLRILTPYLKTYIWWTTCKKPSFLQCLEEHMLNIRNKSPKAQGPRPKAQGHKIEKKQKRIWKIKVWSQCPTKFEQLHLGNRFALPKSSFFEVLGSKNKHDLWLVNVSKNGDNYSSQVPPRARAQWLLARDFGRWLRRISNTPMGHWPGGFGQLRLILGVIWFRHAETCQETNPNLYNFLRFYLLYIVT